MALDSVVGFLISVFLMIVGLQVLTDEEFIPAFVLITVAVILGLWSMH